MKNNVQISIEACNYPDISLLFSKLMGDKQFRGDFFNNGEKAQQKLLNNIPKKEINRLLKYKWVNKFRQNTGFNDRVLLCCAVGY